MRAKRHALASNRPAVRPLTSQLKRLEGTKLYDVLAASPLIAAYGWFLVRDTPNLVNQFETLTEAGLGLGALVSIAGRLLSLLVAGILVLSVFVRTVPVRKTKTLFPKLVALVGAAGGVALLGLPEAPLPQWVAIVSVALVLAGLSGMFLSFLWLRHAFSVFPEARVLVTTGPYALTRHPVYLFEEITFFGMMLQFAQPWAFLIFVIQCTFQLARIPYEERVLREAFPEYAGYAARTARLVPGIY